MKRYKSIFLLPILFLLGLSLTAPKIEAAEQSFTDYQTGNFGYESVSQLVSEGIIQGYKDNSFQPSRAVNRMETAIMFKRALPIEAVISGSGFKDVPDTSEFAQATAAVKTAGIFKGSTNGTFGSNDLLTREQMASVIVRAFGFQPNSAVAVPLNDLDQVSAAHLHDVKVLYQNGITEGKKNGSFDPKGTVTRAEFSVFLDRALKNIPGLMGNLQAKVTNTALKTSGGIVNGHVASNNRGIQIIYNLTTQNKENTFTEGTITVSEAVTLKITQAPSYVKLVLNEGDFTQQLTQGVNKLSFADKLNGIKLGTISSLVDNFSLQGIISDSKGNSKPVTIHFIVKLY
ncbi:S-layer homology domain-containing protein [Bacillus tuaregi]|uniref:S-layer homology domain-containing protein n=1 Tax=Bacillus tuaregi TaxID=1816695 RepID=UPI0008F8D2BE|nr:S-layer homology domain-containing protein [Bacillus tuaregi]